MKRFLAIASITCNPLLCYIDMRIYNIHDHIDMIRHDCHIPTMKVETVMSDTPLLDSSVATCGWVGVDVGVWVWMCVCGCGYM